MPDRIIRERACASPTLKALSDGAERVFWRGISKSDDYGRFDADPEVWLSRCFEARPAGWTLRKMSRVLDELEHVGVIHRYEIGNGHVYAHYVTFPDHQRERDSKPKFPDPPCGGSPQSAAKCRDSRLARARSGSRESGVESRESRVGSNTSPRHAEEPSWPSPDALVALYNAETPDECPAVSKLSPARRKKAQQYLAAFPDRAWWLAMFRRIKGSPFLRGLKPSPGHESFRADFDWLLSRGKDGTENVVKVAEGKYDRG